MLQIGNFVTVEIFLYSLKATKIALTGKKTVDVIQTILPLAVKSHENQLHTKISCPLLIIFIAFVSFKIKQNERQKIPEKNEKTS